MSCHHYLPASFCACPTCLTFLRIHLEPHIFSQEIHHPTLRNLSTLTGFSRFIERAPFIGHGLVEERQRHAFDLGKAYLEERFLYHEARFARDSVLFGSTAIVIILPILFYGLYQIFRGLLNFRGERPSGAQKRNGDGDSDENDASQRKDPQRSSTKNAIRSGLAKAFEVGEKELKPEATSFEAITTLENRRNPEPSSPSHEVSKRKQERNDCVDFVEVDKGTKSKDRENTNEDDQRTARITTETRSAKPVVQVPKPERIAPSTSRDSSPKSIPMPSTSRMHIEGIAATRLDSRLNTIPRTRANSSPNPVVSGHDNASLRELKSLIALAEKRKEDDDIARTLRLRIGRLETQGVQISFMDVDKHLRRENGEAIHWGSIPDAPDHSLKRGAITPRVRSRSRLSSSPTNFWSPSNSLQGSLTVQQAERLNRRSV